LFEGQHAATDTYLSDVDAAWDTKLRLRTFMLTDDAHQQLKLESRTQPVDATSLFPQVAFPDGASMIYQADTSTLFVRNHVESLDMLGVMLDTMGILKKSEDFDGQVVIEAKFVEVSDGLLEELGFQWNFTDGSEFGILGEDELIVDDDIGRGSNEAEIDSVFVGPSPDFNQTTNYVLSTVAEYGLFSDGLRGSPANPQLPFGRTIDLGDGGLRASGPWAVNRIVDGFNNTPSTATFRLEKSDPIELMVSALDQNSGANVLSAPRIVTRSGEEALLRVGELHYFPEVYEGSSSQGTIINISYEDFEETLLGIEMVVVPKVEGGQITLQINPVIRELAGWQRYQLASADSIYNYRQMSKSKPYVHPAIQAQLPIFKVRKIETEVTMNNGSTIAMGGLISEKVLSFNDKVPLLGDIPIAGRLFRNEGERSVKRNLLIFVTATIVEPNGQVHVSKSFQ
jgi:general secretion pathway protein D